MLPNIYVKTSVFIPVVAEIIITPTARKLLENNAKTASPFILLFLFKTSKKIAAKTTTGIDTKNGAQFMAQETENAENPTCDNVSPIIEYLFKTKFTPKIAIQKDIKKPAKNALLKKG